MLIGLTPFKKPAPAAGNDNENIYSVTSQEFETRILAESQKRPVLIDFWAPWCGPCKQLTPVLEEAIKAKDGKVALAKVDIDQNPELAQAFRVQSIPFVIAFYKGQPVSGFQGARPKSEVDALLNQLVLMKQQDEPDALDIPRVLEEAANQIKENNLEFAQQLYGEVLAQDPLNAQALAGMIRILIAANQIEEARRVSAGLPASLAKDPHMISARAALELASNPAGDLSEVEKKLAADPANPDLLFEQAEACYAAGHKEKAVEALIISIQKNKGWEDDKARKQLLKYFEAWGHADSASMAGRRKLSSLLFS